MTNSWTPASSPPPVSQEDVYSALTSGPLLVARKIGNLCVARYETWDTPPYDGDEPVFKWVTDDSEGWTITEEVTHWMPLPPKPSKGA